MKNQKKIDQKSPNNQSKMDKKSIQNRPKLRSGGIRGRFGGLLGRLGRSKALWRHLGPSWRRLGGVLEASWAVLGREKWPTWLQLGPPKRSQNQLKIDTKIDQFFSASWNRFLEGFWWILEAKMKQSCVQNGIKNRC